jgi:hypothetical protein
MRKVALLGAVIALALSLAGAGSVVGGAGVEERPASLTIYTGNLALVRLEVDRVLVPGEQTVRIDGLPTNIDPSSLTVLNAGVTLLGSHGFRSYQDAASGPGASVELDLEVERQVDRVQLAFLTSGLNWSADYTMVIARDDATARVDGYANLSNGSGTTYEGAEVQLLAGTIQRGMASPYMADELRAARSLMEAAAAPDMTQAAFGDYHLYTLSDPLTLRSGESRRIRMVGASAVTTRKEYVLTHNTNYYQQYPEPQTSPVSISYVVDRPRDSDFGNDPLPGGQVRMLQRDDAGRIQPLGISSIANTPSGESIRLAVGYAFDIVGKRTQMEYTRPANNVYESSWRVELSNGGDSDVTVQVIERTTGDWRIVESSHDWQKLSAGAVLFSVDVPAGGEVGLEYRIQVRT